jgi:hypothetical protein
MKFFGLSFLSSPAMRVLVPIFAELQGAAGKRVVVPEVRSVPLSCCGDEGGCVIHQRHNRNVVLCFNCSKATHRVVALFDATVILLQPIIQICTRPMLDMAAHRLAYGSWIRAMPIGGNLIGSLPNHSNSLLEKPLGSFHISLLA